MSRKYTVVELKKICKTKGIKGYSRMKKAELMKHCLKKTPSPQKKKIVKKKKSPKKRSSPRGVLDSDVMGIITGFAKEDESMKKRRVILKEASKKLKKHIKDKRDFNKEITDNNKKINQTDEHKYYLLGHKLEFERTKYERIKKKYQALVKTKKQLQKASLTELREWAKAMKVPIKLTKTKKAKILAAVNEMAEELGI